MALDKLPTLARLASKAGDNSMMQVAMRLGVSLRSIEGYTSGRSFPLSQFWRGVVANYAPSSAVLGKLLQEILENDNRNDRQA